MKLPVALIPFAAGSLTAVAINFAAAHYVENQHRELPRVQQLIEEIGPGNGTPALLSHLPLDAIPTEVPGEKSQGRPVIQFKSDSSIIRVTKTSELVPETKDPIWRIELVTGGKVVDGVDALIGRASKQSANRQVAGNQSPLPAGRYLIDRNLIEKGPFDTVELGRGYWIPIEPTFATARSSLGIHQDPSWGLRNGESGTSGCIGLKSAKATEKVVGWIKDFNIRVLQVVS